MIDQGQVANPLPEVCRFGHERGGDPAFCSQGHVINSKFSENANALVVAGPGWEIEVWFHDEFWNRLVIKNGDFVA